MTRIKTYIKKAALVLSAAIVSAIGPVWQMSAYAEGEILVKIPGASGVENSTWGIWDFT